MFNWLKENIQISVSGFFQIIALLLAGILSTLALAAGFKAKRLYIKKNAKRSRLVIVFMTLISIIGVLFSGFESKKATLALNDSLRSAHGRIDTLKRKLDSSRSENVIGFKSQSNLIIKKQRESSDQLALSATKLSDLIGGTDSVPIFRFIVFSPKKIIGGLINLNSKPAFNVEGYIANYDSLIACKQSRILLRDKKLYNAIDQDCWKRSLLPIGATVLRPGEKGTIDPLPLAPSYPCSHRYIVMLTFKDKVYEEECYFDYVNGAFFQSVRIIETKNNKLLRSWIYQVNDDFPEKNLKVDWDKEFPLKIYNTFRWQF
ncbi:hypothetical protein SAMN05421821_103359 [Mucilaginibacter lappiensis]|uniref:Uncharacterized protein n=1 Tax=Mucilaginibacter lappiensis TaxID=354630 RepID=A0ABR6PHP5_9SPHI|nr:hypothetical protein [Mucilaginibacter lappiensis]MBB6109123.1 hypothetical protein [Mucilaginibacter lappiensis]SIQ76534.1 hypothetical protein SAMN05421821_103359 [Mucilaginibacter lappiensis]